MKRLMILTTLLAVGVLSMVIARVQQDLTAILIEKVKDRLYVITGGRGSGAQAGTISGNTTVFVADSGVVLVEDTVITGHSTTTTESGESATFTRSNPVMRWADLEEYAAFLRDFIDAAQAARKAGKTVDEA